MERRRVSGNRPTTNKERSRQWFEIDGVDVSEVPRNLLNKVMRTIRETRGVYGDSHDEALHHIYNTIQDSKLSAADKAGLIVSSTKDIVGRENRTPEADEAYYRVRHEILPHVLGASFFVKAGKELGAALEEDGQIDRRLIVGPNADDERFPTIASVSPAVASQVIRRLNEYELTQYGLPEGYEDYEPVNEYENTDDNDPRYVTIGTRKKAARYLDSGLIEASRMMSKYYESPTQKFDSIEGIVKKLDKHDDESRVDKVNLHVEGDSLRVLAVNELRIGHQDGKAGLQLVDQIVEHLKTQPVDKLPNVILVSNLIQSDYEYSQSQKRQALGLEHIAEQLNAANVVLDKLRELGVPVVVSLGEDDHRMAKDAAVNYVNEMNGIVKEGGKENFIPYYGLNKAMQDRQHQVQKRFYLEHILPLTYRMGRPLRGRDAVNRDTGGEINYSEYFALYEYINYGGELPAELGIDPEIIVPSGEWKDGVCFVDDFNLVAETEGATRDIAYRHVTDFTAESLKANTMGPVMKLLGSLAASQGVENMADLVITGQQQMQMSLANRAVTLPGLADSAQSLNRKQYYSSAPGDASRRFNYIRGVPSVPTLTQVEMTDDGRFIQSFVSKEFMEKADSLPRTAVFQLCDMQIGSPSARPDLQVLLLSYMLETAKDKPIAIQVNGDIIHGHIYPTFPEESQSVGLISLKSQKEHVRQIFNGVFDTSDSTVRSLVENVIDVVVQPGNHDKIMRPRFPNNLDDNIDYLVHDSEQIFGKDKVRHEAIARSADGTPVATWAARTYLGAYSLQSAHYHLERGMRGGGGYPVADAYKRVQGLGERAPDIVLGAHWHNPQTAMFGNVLSVIGGPMAGQTEFEDFRGMKAVPYGTVIYVGGGESVAVESITAQGLRNLAGAKMEVSMNGKHREVSGTKYGIFTPQRLAEEGLYDDDGFDPAVHGPYLHDGYPKSANQKKILQLKHAASNLVMFEAEIKNPNKYDLDGNPEHLNDLTKRAFEIAAKQEANR